jgi:hypothetical protein
MSWFESDSERLARWSREQRETNQRLHESFRAESLARSDIELRQRWSEMGLDEDKTEEWFRQDRLRRKLLAGE